MSDDGGALFGGNDNGGETEDKEAPSDINVVRVNTKTTISHHFQRHWQRFSVSAKLLKSMVLILQSSLCH